MMNSQGIDDVDADLHIDAILQKNWRFAAKKILEKMCKHEIRVLHIGRGLALHPQAFIGDAEYIFACSIAFKFGPDNNLFCLDQCKYSLTNRRTMVDVYELNHNDEQFAMYSLFYTGQPIVLSKNKYGMNGASIAPRSILDATRQVGISAEELLVHCDLVCA